MKTILLKENLTSILSAVSDLECWDWFHRKRPWRCTSGEGEAALPHGSCFSSHPVADKVTYAWCPAKAECLAPRSLLQENNQTCKLPWNSHSLTRKWDFEASNFKIAMMFGEVGWEGSGEEGKKTNLVGIITEFLRNPECKRCSIQCSFL